MSNKLKNIIQGDTKRWRLTWPTNIAGATVLWTMKRRKSQTDPDLQISGTLDAPDGAGDVFGVAFHVSPAESATLAVGNYHAEHEITLASGDVGTILQQRIAIVEDLD